MTEEQAADVVRAVARVDASEVLIIESDGGCHAVMGRAIAHAGTQMTRSGDDWFVAVRTMDGAWFYIHDPELFEVRG